MRKDKQEWHRKYEKTRKGHLMRTYQNMRARVRGKTTKPGHGKAYWLGLPIMSMEDFYKWALKDKSYNELYDLWKRMDYEQKFTPSIDRKDPSRGYVRNNVRFLTTSQNSRLGGRNAHR